MTKLKVKLKRGLAGKDKKVIKTIKALGLKKTGDTKVFEKNKAIEGMVKKVFYMVEVKEEN